MITVTDGPCLLRRHRAVPGRRYAAAHFALPVWLAWGHGLNLTGVLLAAAFYLVTGLGVTIEFRRVLTHRSFTAAQALGSYWPLRGR